MTSLTTANADAILKNLYRPKKVEDGTYSRRPLLGLLPKFESFGGRNMPIPLKFANAQGRSAVFATAQANRTQTRFVDYDIDIVSDYSVATIDGTVIDRTKSDTVAWLSAMSAQIDGAMAALADAHETFLFRAGTGSIGTVNTAVASATITLADISDVTNFEVGMTLAAAATDGGATRVGTEVLLAVNRATGVLTSTSANWNTVIVALAIADLLNVAGDGANAGANVKISGLPAWLPATVAATAFFGLDRTTDTVRLGGNRTTQTGVTVEEALVNGDSIAAREGAAIDTWLLNHIKVRRLVREIGAKTQYHRVIANGAMGAKTGVGYKAVTIDGSGDDGTAVIACNKCTSTLAYGLEKATWSLVSIGPAVKFLMDDSLKILRQATADGYEVRLGGRLQLACYKPGSNIRVTLDAE